MSVPIRLLIADGLQVFCESLASFLVKQDRLAVVGMAADAAEALRMTENLQPDIMLVGPNLGKRAAIGLTSELSSKQPHPKLIILGMLEEEQSIFEFIEAGASGYTVMQSSLTDLVQAIEAVHSGEAICSPRVAFSMFERIAQLSRANQDHAEIPPSILSAREEEILQLIADGLSNKQIADRLYISPCTVKNHVHHILEKLEVRSRAQAVDYALEKRRLPVQVVLAGTS
jgi:DNA-binding NarL/FixJ family response regulator